MLAATACASQQTALGWGPCAPYAQTAGEKELYADQSVDCARLTVPLDYADPHGRTVSIGLLRHRATDPAHRIGSLVLNPGGPGSSGMTAAATLARSAGKLAEQFDLVGFDPRGVHASEPRIGCRSDAEQDAARASGVEGGYAEGCLKKTGAEFLAHVGTREVVRDLDALRAALGDAKLTYLGYSYGTQIGSAYAEAYPGRVRAMVLDGAIDPAQDLPQTLIAQAAGFQDAFTQFAQWCAKRPSCPLSGDATAAFQRIARTPAPALPGRGLSFPDAVTATEAALYSRAQWPNLQQALEELATKRRGPTLLRMADAYYQRDQNGHYSGAIDGYYAVRCVDYDRVTDRATIDAAHRQMLTTAPFLTGTSPDARELDTCSAWPVPPTSRTHRPSAPGLPKTLVVSTTHDPATPYRQGVALAKDLNAALLTVDDVQHAAFLKGNACVDKAATAYLITTAARDGSC
ncbi:alpha/beta hydrolase [Amycolatopsis silviterrae]|uniref:Alpha/beta hydrolase n=1 Tax=Amycolatopsis silviterrae TaxID=1656914 RepID=A0ABW5HDU4_9PSEU